MSVATIQNINAEIRTLNQTEKLTVINLIVASLREEPLEPKRKRSLLELRGLGKEIWRGIDPAEYIREERDSWQR